MTNREMLINALQDKNDDWAATESDIAYNIACPYTDLEGHPCDNLVYPWDTLRVCGQCKIEWLDKEVSE